ncbi:MAG: cation:proton antiporter [Planctomycetota bacterium]|nr:MAG: cation:proton antiporter [Planctomycetota bacterium]
MPAEALTTFCFALAIGLGAFLVAGRLRVPAIVPLLLFGMLSGPALLGVVRPTALGTSGLKAIVLGAVLVILFEGSLSLRLPALQAHGGPITRLVTLGALVTWFGATLACRLVLGVGWPVAVLTGAILIVTGPTVVLPLLRNVRPNARLREILRWEGILIDPIGAIAAIVTFDFLLAVHRGGEATIGAAVLDYLWMALDGTLFGALGALVIYGGLRAPKLVPRELVTPFALAVMLAAAAGAETVEHESSLFAAVVAGVLLAALSPPHFGEIERFKGELTTVLLAVLFVLLAASLEPAEMAALGWRGVLFVAALQVVRLVCVLVCTAGTDLRWPERLFLAWLSPRGIVAASVASIFGARLVSEGIAGAETIVPVVFLVILATVTVQGLLARPVGSWLGVLAPPRRNIVIAGATPFSVALARALERAGIETVIIERSPSKARAAEDLGAVVYEGDALAPATYADVDLEATGAYLAATTNDEVNGLAAHLASEIIGAEHVLQLPSGEHSFDLIAHESAAMRSPLAFGERFTLASLDRALRQGARIVVHELAAPETAPALRARLGTDFRPLITIEARTGMPSFVSERGARLPAGRVVGIENLPPALLPDDPASPARPTASASAASSGAGELPAEASA